MPLTKLLLITIQLAIIWMWLGIATCVRYVGCCQCDRTISVFKFVCRNCTCMRESCNFPQMLTNFSATSSTVGDSGWLCGGGQSYRSEDLWFESCSWQFTDCGLILGMRHPSSYHSQPTPDLSFPLPFLDSI